MSSSQYRPEFHSHARSVTHSHARRVIEIKQVVEVRRRTVQSYSPGGANVPSHEGALAPPGEYGCTCASFGPPESTIQTANRSVQPFLHSSRQKVPILTMDSSFPQNRLFRWGIWTPSNTWFSGPTRVLNPNGISIGSAVFAGLTSVTDRPSDDATRSVTKDRIYVCSTGDAV